MTDDALPASVKPLRPEVALQLQGIEPTGTASGPPYFPCQAVTDDGQVYPRVFVMEARAYLREWGVWPWDDSAKCWLPAENICSLRSSPQRLPARYSELLLTAGESGMGYCAFSILLRDGRKLYFVTGNAVDFPRWPAGVGPDDVVAVHPHERHPEHRHRAPRADELSDDYFWAPYRAE